MSGEGKPEVDLSGRQTGSRGYFSDNGDSMSDHEMDDLSRTGANNLATGMAFLRRRHKWTYIHFAIHFLCFVYWITRSSTYMGVLPSWNSGTSLDQPNNALEVDSSHGVLSSSTPQDGSSAVSDKSKAALLPESDKVVGLMSSSSAIKTYPAEFPKQVWQTASEDGRKHWAKFSKTWQDLEGWQYNFLTDDDADLYVISHFNETSPAIVHFWNSLTIPVLRADFLRYLIMLASGGIYSDIDTDVLMHPRQWIPTKYAEAKVNAIIGIEYDDTTYPLFVRPISFNQWTLMSKPGHPIFETAVQRLMSNLDFIARRDRKDLSDVVPSKADILQGTGPCMITDVVMQVIRDQGYDIEWGTFHEQKEAVLYGDVLILPVNGFAGAQKHSHSGDPEYGQRFVAHHFGRSWYQKDKDQAN